MPLLERFEVFSFEGYYRSRPGFTRPNIGVGFYIIGRPPPPMMDRRP